MTEIGPEPFPVKVKKTTLSGVPAVFGRRHADLQTDSWLEEMTDNKDEKHVGVQAAPSDKYSEISAAGPADAVEVSTTKVDKETQIYPNDPQLFVFEDEVKMIQGGFKHKLIILLVSGESCP